VSVLTLTAIALSEASLESAELACKLSVILEHVAACWCLSKLKGAATVPART